MGIPFQIIAVAQTQVVPLDSDGYLAFSNVGFARPSDGEISHLFQLGEEINTRLNIVQAPSVCQCCRIDRYEGVRGLAWVSINADHVLVGGIEQVLECFWRILYQVGVDDKSLRAPILGTPVVIGIFEARGYVIPVRMLIGSNKPGLDGIWTESKTHVADITMCMGF